MTSPSPDGRTSGSAAGLPAIDPALCPACGEANGCAMAAGLGPAVACWCTAVVVDRAWLAGQSWPPACLCPSCLDAAPDALASG